MKIVFSKVELLEVLSKIQGLTSRKTSLAITENILIQTAGDEVVMAATDLETGFKGRYSAAVESEGSISINSRKLYDIVKMFPADQVHMEELENRWVAITSDTVQYHLMAMNPEEFPEIPDADKAAFFETEAAGLKTMIEKCTAITVSGDEKRAHLIGVNLETVADGDKNCIRMVSTDIRRLAKVDYICETAVSLDQEGQIIVPKKGLNEVNKFLGQDGTVEVGVKDNHFAVRKDNEILIINLLEGEFPAYANLLDFDSTYDVIFPREPLVMMLKRMSVVTSDEYRAVIFRYAENNLQVRAVNPNIGESKESMEIRYDREPLEVAFNPRYFIEALNFIENENVAVNIVDGEHPCVVRGQDETNYLNIIMPMKI